MRDTASTDRQSTEKAVFCWTSDWLIIYTYDDIYIYIHIFSHVAHENIRQAITRRIFSSGSDYSTSSIPCVNDEVF